MSHPNVFHENFSVIRYNRNLCRVPFGDVYQNGDSSSSSYNTSQTSVKVDPLCVCAISHAAIAIILRYKFIVHPPDRSTTELSSRPMSSVEHTPRLNRARRKSTLAFRLADDNNVDYASQTPRASPRLEHNEKSQSGEMRLLLG